MKEDFNPTKKVEDSYRVRKDLISSGKIKEFFNAKEYDFEKLPNKLQFLTKSGLDIIEKYLSYPTITDVFTEHKNRREWRSSLSKESQEMYDKNALRRNNIASTLNAVDFVILDPDFAELFKEEKENMYAELINGWTCDEEHPDGVFTTEEKIKYVENKLKPFLLKVRKEVVNK